MGITLHHEAGTVRFVRCSSVHQKCCDDTIPYSLIAILFRLECAYEYVAFSETMET